MKFFKAFLITLFLLSSIDCPINETPFDYLSAGNAKIAQKDCKGAIDDYNRAIDANQNNAKIYHYRGMCKDSLEDYRGAISDYNKAIEIDPKSEDALVGFAVVKQQIEDYLGAQKVYEKI